MRKVIYVLISVLTSLSAIAHDFEAGGIYYNIISSTENTVSVTHKDGLGGLYSGDINIPETVTNDGVTYTVTCIGVRAFVFCEYLNSVVIPNTVTEIGEAAFDGCLNLASVTASNSLKRIGYRAFNFCFTLPVVDNCRYAGTILTEVIDKNATSINIQPWTRYLAQDTFRECPNLTTIKIPDSVVLIDANSFYGCPNLESVTLSESLEKIGSDAFNNCKKLTSIHIPRYVNEIDIDAFINCDALNSITVDPANSVYDSRSNCNAVIETENGKLIAGCNTSTIPNSVISLRDHAFRGCINMKTIAIPRSVSAIGNDVFFGCYSLGTITVDAENHTFDSRDNCNAIIITSTGTLIRGCNNSTIPNGVKVIIDNAFYNCGQLANVNFPDGLTTIGNKAFSGCANITKAILPNSVTTIGSEAFSGCTKLETLSIGNGLTQFNKDTFSGCENIKTLSLDSQVIVGAEYDTDRNAMTKVFGSNVEDVTIGDSVTEIGICAFYCFQNLRTVKFGKNIKSIGADAFASTNITEAILPEGLTSIGGGAFAVCPSLKSIWIPKTCTSIGANTFCVTPNAESIIVEEGNPVYDSRDNCNAIIDIATNTIIRGCMNSTIPNTVTAIGVMSFWRCINLKSIKIPDSVTIIGESAFDNCYGLEYIEIGKNVQEIGGLAFDGQDWYTYENLGNINTVKINSQAIVGKNYEKWYSTIPNGIFPGQPIETYIIGDDVTSIGDKAFVGGSNVKLITIGKNVQAVGNSAFTECAALETLQVEAEVPPTCNGDIVEDEAYHTITLEVPNESYATADIWEKFTNFHPTGVDTVVVWDAVDTSDSDVVPVAYYDLLGNQYTEPRQGVNIVRYSNGTAKKININ